MVKCAYCKLNQSCTTACAREFSLDGKRKSCLNELAKESFEACTQYKNTESSSLN